MSRHFRLNFIPDKRHFRFESVIISSISNVVQETSDFRSKMNIIKPKVTHFRYDITSGKIDFA